MYWPFRPRIGPDCDQDSCAGVIRIRVISHLHLPRSPRPRPGAPFRARRPRRPPRPHPRAGGRGDAPARHLPPPLRLRPRPQPPARPPCGRGRGRGLRHRRGPRPLRYGSRMRPRVCPGSSSIRCRSSCPTPPRTGLSGCPGKPVRTVAAPPVPGLVSGLRPTLDLPRPGLRRPSLKTEATRPTVDGGSWGPALISTSHDSTDGPRSACDVDQASANGSCPRRSSTGPGKAPLVHSSRPPASRCGSAGAAPGPAVPSALSSGSVSNARPSTASSDSMDGSPSG